MIPRHRWRRGLIAAPALVALAIVLVVGIPDTTSRFALSALVIAFTIAAIVLSEDRSEHWLRTAFSLVDALREGDYGIRGAIPQEGGQHAHLIQRFNELAAQLQDERRGMAESTQLLSKTLAGLEGAVFAFDGANAHRLRLVNPAGERLLQTSGEALLGRSAESLQLAPLFEAESGAVVSHAFPSAQGRWQVSHANLRSRSQVGRLLVIVPVEQALRHEERESFKRLLRVLSHEINNSIAPIASVSDTLRTRVRSDDAFADAPDLRALFEQGLTLIEQRSLSLQRFLAGYALLAKLPPPQLQPVALEEPCRRVKALLDDGRLDAQAEGDVVAMVDRDQLEQALINLVRNALEASPEDGGVRLRVRADGPHACIDVIDDGPGPPPEEKRFVPFFTTKPGGSGIGLVLSRQIVEAQSGTLVLASRQDRAGTIARITLPRVPSMEREK